MEYAEPAAGETGEAGPDLRDPGDKSSKGEGGSEHINVSRYDDMFAGGPPRFSTIHRAQTTLRDYQ